MSKFKAIFKCWECHTQLSWHKIMHSDGVCPHCGYNSGYMSIKHTKHSVKFIRNSPWWKFWDRSGRLWYAGEGQA